MIYISPEDFDSMPLKRLCAPLSAKVITRRTSFFNVEPIARETTKPCGRNYRASMPRYLKNAALRMIDAGVSTSEISQQLGISTRSIQRWRKEKAAAEAAAS